jgi:diphthine-ammonia ligase
VWGIRPPDPALLDDGKKLGDYIHLRAEKEWVDKVCGDLGLEPILPLWEKTPEQVLIDLMEKGFEAIIVVVNPEYLSEEWLGRKIDQTFLKEIRRLHREKGVPVGGDDYHTFVTDGPLFKKRLKVLQNRKLSRNGYLILDITKVELIEKTGVT